MPENNLIQRPDLIGRMRQFLGIRQKTVIPTLGTVLQPVMIVGDLDRPFRGLATRQGYALGFNVVFSGLTASGLSFGTPTQAPWIRVYPQFLEVTVIRPALTTPTWLDVLQHPISPTLQGVRLAMGRGGDVNPTGRSGAGFVADVVGFPFTGVRLPVQHAVPRVFDLRQWVLEPRNPPPGAGGSGSSLIFAAADGTPEALTLVGNIYWEEEAVED